MLLHIAAAVSPEGRLPAPIEWEEGWAPKSGGRFAEAITIVLPAVGGGGGRGPTAVLW